MESSAHILLHVNVRNDDVLTEKNPITFVTGIGYEMPLGIFT